MSFSVMIFAAGFGTRMMHLTRDRPKPMVNVAGTPLIDHALKLVNALPCEQIVVNTHYKADILETYLHDRDLTLLREEPQILDTGGGLRNALPHLGPAPVITLNADAIWQGDNPLSQLQTAWRPDIMDALLMCVPIAQTVGYAGRGDFTANEEGQLIRGPGLVYGGAQIIKTDLLAQIKEEVFSLNVLWDLMQTKNRLYASIYRGKWCDVGHPGGVDLAEELLKADHV